MTVSSTKRTKEVKDQRNNFFKKGIPLSAGIVYNTSGTIFCSLLKNR